LRKTLYHWMSVKFFCILTLSMCIFNINISTWPNAENYNIYEIEKLKKKLEMYSSFFFVNFHLYDIYRILKGDICVCMAALVKQWNIIKLHNIYATSYSINVIKLLTFSKKQNEKYNKVLQKKKKIQYISTPSHRSFTKNKIYYIVMNRLMLVFQRLYD